MEKIWACEKDFILSYLSKRENISAKDLQIDAGLLEEMGRKSSDILSIAGDTATISITGPLSRSGPDFIDLLFGFGGTSYEDIKDAIAEIEGREDIKTVTLAMDTPGGEVAGVDSVYSAVSALCDKKNVIAQNMGMIASAGMWIACPAKRIEAVEPTAWTGSIGVVITVIDQSKRYEDDGIKVIEIVSRNAPNKRPDAKTQAGRDAIQERADAIERHFLDRVARGRGVSVDYVIENFGQGGVMIAQDLDPDKPDAIKAGLIDGLTDRPARMAVVSEDDMAAEHHMNRAHFEGLGIVQFSETPAVAGRKPGATGPGESQEVQHMDLKQAMAEHPAIKAEVDQMVAEARKAGVDQGRKEVESRVEKASAYIGSEYPMAIQKLAAKVMSGEEEAAALVGAVTYFDAQKELSASEEAKAETADLGDTAPQAGQDAPSGGLIGSEADIVAAREVQ
jgi:ClpP class serine protease